MDDRWTRPGDLGVTRLLRIFAVLSLVFLGVLAVAPARSYFTEWRSVQERYGAVAVAQSKEAIAPAIQQIWKPRIGVVDRCTSCHVGMGAGEPLAQERLFAAHPAIPHEPADFGCTVCHGGQGRATGVEAAHGRTAFWDEPLLDRKNFEAGCGSCHTHLPVASAEAVARGEALFRRHDCTACHRLDGAGRGTAADLTTIGGKEVPADWGARHRARAARTTEPAEAALWRDSYGPLTAADEAALTSYLRSRVGAPRLMAGKSLAHRLGCRGCHKINGVGGDDGPELTAEGRKIAADLDFSGVRGERTLAGWLTEHFEDPARVVAKSLMPNLGLSRAEAESLTLYMLSLRAADVPEALWPRDRVRGVKLGEREFATDGASLFGAFCAGCHGERGEGLRFGNVPGVVFPAIGNRDFLAIASDEYLRSTIVRGRPGRRMPAWGEKEGGLRAAEIDAVVAHLRSLAPGTPELLPPAPTGGSAERGAPLYARSCAGCHGERGEGREAPSLANPAFQAAASDAYLAASILRGRAGTSMRHFGGPAAGVPTLDGAEVADVVAFLRKLGAEGASELLR